jgi:uncharacterized protein (UPF0128 family)
MKRLIILFMFLFIAGAQAQWPPVGMNGDGTSSNPWQITDSTHLRILANYVNAGSGDSTNGKYYKLINDIDLSVYSSGTGWMPIGKDVWYSELPHCFQGNFDGNNKIIYNLTINRPVGDYMGLFGRTYFATIENLGIENGNIIGQSNVGGLVGRSNNTLIFNCYATGSINGSTYVGGLVGYNNNSNISKCYTTSNIAFGDIIGGLVGWNNNNSFIFNCYATGSTNGSTSIGGLVGANTIAIIFNCYATGDASGSSSVGGLVGFNLNAIISNCYAKGKVVGKNTIGSMYIGGLVGEYASGIIYNCIAANDSVIVNTNQTTINRIAGSGGGTSVYKNNYALNSMVVQINGLPVIITDSTNLAGIGKIMDTLQSFAFYADTVNWDSTAWNISPPLGIWKICDGYGLPFLRWQHISCGDTLNITAITGNNGSINPSGIVNILDENSQTFTFTADACSEIDSLWIDGIYKPDSINAGSYTFKHLIENHLIEVKFKLKNYFSSDSVTTCSNMPYYLGGKYLTISGIYYDTVQTALGCDSIIKLTLTVNPTYIISDTAEICQGESYLFHGKDYTIAGVYYDTLQSIQGCDSIFELTLTVNPAYIISDTAEICQGESYLFRGKDYTVAGVYYDTLQNIQGCDSIFELKLTENPTYIVFDTAVISQGETYNFNDKSLTEAGVYYDILQTFLGCDSIIELTLTVSNVGMVTTTNYELRIYPNPTTGKLTMDNGERTIESIEIFDVLGQKLSTVNHQLSTHQIDISHLPTGVYLLKIYTKGNQTKIIKVKILK